MGIDEAAVTAGGGLLEVIGVENTRTSLLQRMRHAGQLVITISL